MRGTKHRGGRKGGTEKKKTPGAQHKNIFTPKEKKRDKPSAKNGQGETFRKDVIENIRKGQGKKGRGRSRGYDSPKEWGNSGETLINKGKKIVIAGRREKPPVYKKGSVTPKETP